MSAAFSLRGISGSILGVAGFELSLNKIGIKTEFSFIDGFGIATGINFDFGY